MTIEKAKKLLEEEYENAKHVPFVCDPVAFALYQVWKQADIDWRKNR